jgi:hypothetical protein
VRQPIGQNLTDNQFLRSDLDNLGLNPRTRDTLERLPQDRDTLVQEIDETNADLNKVEGEPILTFDSPITDILTNTRKLAGGDNVTATVGADTVDLDLSDTTVMADTYGAATKLIVLAIDAKGRVTSASEVALESGNVTETTKLFFTDARARGALSAGSHISYNSGTGAIAFSGTGVSTTVANPTSITVSDGLITAIS